MKYLDLYNRFKYNYLFVSELEIKNTIFWNTTYKKSRGLIIGESSSITLKDSAFLNFFTSCFSLNNAQFSLSTSFFYNDDDFIMQTQTYFSIGSIIEITTSVSTNITNCLFHNFTSLSNGTGVKLSNSQDSTIFIASCIFIELTVVESTFFSLMFKYLAVILSIIPQYYLEERLIPKMHFK